MFAVVAGTGPILLDHLFCDGSESRLIDCPRMFSIGMHSCGGFYGVGVRCHVEGVLF